jgi:uncharacterized membrane protein
MNNLKIQRKRLESYFGTRKYKLSFWGINPHLDWLVLITYFFIGLIFIFSIGLSQRSEKLETLSEKADVENNTKREIDIEKIENMIYLDYKISKDILNSEFFMNTDSSAQNDFDFFNLESVTTEMQDEVEVGAEIEKVD